MNAIPELFHLDRLILGLAEAFDLAGPRGGGHARRVALMAARLAEELNRDAEDELRPLLRAALLHDCGVASTSEHHQLMGASQWDEAAIHARRGADYLAAVPMLAPLVPLVAEHHTPWSKLVSRRVDEPVALLANLICLADRADAARQEGVLPGRNVVERLRAMDGCFAPGGLAALDRLARVEAFWFGQDEPMLSETLASLLARFVPEMVSTQDLAGLATVVGGIIDGKSPYTERHSSGVARLAAVLGRHMGLAEPSCRALGIAGLLHDIGKLRVPDELLDRQGALDAAERLTMARHPYDSRVILTHALGPGGIADWAGFHHECLSGQGYPFHVGEAELSTESRILAVADVFQALAQHRPFRSPLLGGEIASLLDGMVFGGRLDGQVVAVAKEHLEECLQAAHG